MLEFKLWFGTELLTVWVDDEDEDLLGLPWTLRAARQGCYVARKWNDNGVMKHERLHRIILERKIGRKLVKGELPDHKDRNKLNNTRNNLRVASHSQNGANRLGRMGRELPHGVYRDRDKFRAQLRLEGIDQCSGAYQTPEEASKVFRTKHVEIYGEFSPYFTEEQDGPQSVR